MQLNCFETKLTNLKLKTRAKQLLGSLPLDTALLGYTLKNQDFVGKGLKNNYCKSITKSYKLLTGIRSGCLIILELEASAIY
jgi:hypothetical protein